ncbi:hemolysin secretion protein D [Bacteroidia bacterium]|nr:hemolysin secretion protein D [Bacteroidia bacterium]
MDLTTAKRDNNLWLAFIVLVVALILIAIVGWFILKPKTEILQGQVETVEIRISGKVPGRILKINVKEGDRVQKGDTLVILDSPEVNAKMEQAQAAENAAQAQNAKAEKGTRSEQIAAAQALWNKAKAGLDIAEKSYRRVQNLYDEGVVSAQKRDEAEANYQAMKATERAAYSQFQMATNGAQQEDKLAAQALVNVAKGTVNEVEAYISETFLISPIDGEISEIFVHEGELVGTGTPVANVMDKSRAWVVFNVREDLLKDLQVGKSVSAYIPALNKEISLTVFALKDMGAYAAWKATKTTGQYDLRTFSVKARPDVQEESLYPGMSAIIKEKRIKK